MPRRHALRDRWHAVQVLMNAHYEDVDFKMAAPNGVAGWRLVIGTARGLIEPDEPAAGPGASVTLPARALLLYVSVL